MASRDGVYVGHGSTPNEALEAYEELHASPHNQTRAVLMGIINATIPSEMISEDEYGTLHRHQTKGAKSMNTLIEARKIYNAGIVDGAMRHSNNLIKRMQKKDEKYAKPRFTSAIQESVEVQNLMQLQAEQLGYDFEEPFFTLNNLLWGFAGLVIGTLINALLLGALS